MTAPTLAGAALLVLAGLPKLRTPGDTTRAIRSVGIAMPAWLVRVGGLVEAGLGVVTLVIGGAVASGLVALSYLGFSGFVVIALRRGGVLSSCGCLGRPDTPPTRGHVGVTGLFATAAAVAAAVGSPVGMARLSGVTPARLVALIGYTALVTALGWLALSELPRLTVVRRPAHG